MNRLLVLSLVLSSAFAVGCSSDDEPFTQWDGFAELIADRTDAIPTAAEIELLEHYKPILHLPDGHEGPMDFYRDYIAQGCLETGAGIDAGCQISPETLNEHKNDPAAVFTHIPSTAKLHPVAYGTVWHGTVTLPGFTKPEQDWTFLIYNFVFRNSGLPAGLEPMEEFLISLIADPADWHQLDHYTAVVIALDEHKRPQAAMYMQHNYMRTFIIGTDPAISTEGIAEIDVAMRSNEFYPHRAARTAWPAASFISPDSIGYLAGIEDKPMMASQDITDSARTVDYDLLFLPQNDAFYVFAGSLGAKRLMDSRNGPPGAIFYTLPKFWPYEISMFVYYIKQQDKDIVAAIRDENSDEDDFITFQQQRFAADLCSTRNASDAC